MKVEDIKKKEYQASFREKKKADKNEEPEKKVDQAMKVAEKMMKRTERKKEILEYQRQYRENMKAEKMERERKKKAYQAKYRKMLKN